MSASPMWRRYLRFLGPDAEADLDDELRFHVEQRTAELVARGMAPERARAEALARLGDLREVKRACRRIERQARRRREWRERLQGVAREARQAARALRKSPGFAVVVVLALALGIGATTAIFTLLDAVVLRPLPYPEADRLVYVDSPVPGHAPDAVWGLSEAGYHHFVAESRTLAALGAFYTGHQNLSGRGEAERLRAAPVTASMMAVLGARAALGRVIQPEDDRPGAAPIAVLGYDFWKRRFGGDPGIVGATLTLNDAPVEVVGVMAPGLSLPDHPVDVWRPMRLDPLREAVNSHWMMVAGRMRPGVTVAEVQEDLSRLTAQFVELFPRAYDDEFMRDFGFSTRVRPLHEKVLGGAGRTLWLLLAAVALVLLIACASVANLFLVRMEARRHEVAIRTALGAGRTDLARHALSESLILALLAGVLGLGLGGLALRVLLVRAPVGLPRLDGVALGGRSVVFALLLSLGIGLVFGLLPLLRGERGLSVLREGGRGLSASRRRRAVRGGLVVAQTALALVLLAASGVMLRSFARLSAVQPGLDPRNVLTLEVFLPPSRYPGYEEVSRFHRELAARLEALAEVRSVGVSHDLPLKDFGGCSIVFVEDRPPATNPAPCVATPQASPGYFRALGIPLRGAEPTWTETERGTAGVVVTRTLAERIWPGEDPIGKGIRGNNWREPFYRVVGVTGDLRAAGLDQPPVEAVFFPLIPMEGAPLWVPPNAGTLVVKSNTDRPLALTATVRRAVAELDPSVPIANVQTMEALLAASMARVSFALLLLALAAAMALLLSAIGIHGVVSYLVGQRRTEIGIRMALGARAAQVSRLVVLQSVRPALLGIVLGLLGALATTRALRSLLFEVSPTDPATLLAVSALLVALAVAASYLPAQRAARVDPVEALRD